MIARSAWYTLLALIAAVTIAVQIDRQSAVAAPFAEITPEPFRGFAQMQRARQAVDSADGSTAVAQAKRLVERRPLPAEPLRLLAQAQLKAGLQDEAMVTIQIAALRGWRDTAAQEAVLRLALAAGDEAEAVRRYTALFLGRSSEDALLLDFGERLFTATNGEAARTMTDIVVGSERRRSTFLARGARVIPPKPFVSIIAQARGRGATFDCSVMDRAVAALKTRDAASGRRLEDLARKSCF